MCECILTRGNNQEGPSQTMWMFVKHEIAFDSTVGDLLFDCLNVPLTLTIHEFSPLFWPSDGDVTWTATRGVALWLMDAAETWPYGVGVGGGRVEGGGKGSRILRC